MKTCAVCGLPRGSTVIYMWMWRRRFKQDFDCLICMHLFISSVAACCVCFMVLRGVFHLAWCSVGECHVMLCLLLLVVCRMHSILGRDGVYDSFKREKD